MDAGTIGVIISGVTVVNGALFFVIRILIRSAIAENNATLVSQINGTYVRTALWNEREKSHGERFDRIENDLKDLTPLPSLRRAAGAD